LAKAPGKEAEYKQYVISVLTDLLKSIEFKKAIDTYKEVEEATAKLRRVLEEIILLGIVPRQCRVCQRLGM